MADKIGRALFSLECAFLYFTSFYNEHILFFEIRKIFFLGIQECLGWVPALGMKSGCQWVSGRVSKYLSSAYFVPSKGKHPNDFEVKQQQPIGAPVLRHSEFTIGLNSVNKEGCLLSQYWNLITGT